MVVKTLSAREQELLDAALDYAGRGIPVFPCEANGKRPLIKHDARQWGQTTDLDEVRAYWGDLYAGCNIGIPTGGPSRVFVLDVDKKGGAEGHVTLATLIGQNGPLPDTIEAATPSGGNHYLFQHVPGIRNTAGKLGNGLDTRGDGGYIVAVPSAVDGKRYRWTNPPGLFVVAKAPQWLLDLLLREDRPAPPPQDYTPRRAPDAYVQRALDEEYAAVRNASPGTRNDQLNTSAFKLFTMVENYGLDAHVVEQAMTEAALACGLQHHEIKSTLMSARRGGLQKSRPPLPAQEVRPAHNPFQAPPRIDPETGEILDDPAPAQDPDAPFSAAELTGTPPPIVWLVKDWMPRGVIIALYGDGGVGKTLLAQQLLYAAGVGGSWLGMPVPKLRGLGVFCEDDKDELHRRHDAIKASMGITIGNPFDQTWIWPRVGHDNLLVTFDRDNRPTMSAFFQAVMHHVLDKRIEVLVLDTVADLYGGNEIVRAQVNFFIKSTCGSFIRRAKEAGVDLTVILLAHPSQSGKESGRGDGGSTAWSNAVRARLYLTRPEDGGENDRVLSRKKANYASSGDGTAIDLVWREGTIQKRDEKSGVPDRRTCQKMLDDITEAWNAGVPLSTAPQTKKDGRHAGRVLSRRYELNERMVENLVERWLEERILIVAERNSDAKLKGLKVIGSITEVTEVRL